MGGINEWPLPRNIAGDSQHIDHFSHHYAAHSLRLLTNFPLPYPGRAPSPSLYLPVGYGAGARPSLILSRQPMHFVYLPPYSAASPLASLRGSLQAADCAENSPRRPSFGQTVQNPLFAADRGLTPGGRAINIRTVSTRQAIPP